MLPQLESQVSNAIIKQFQTDGTLRVVSVADADIVLSGEITEYFRREVRSMRQDSAVPREYQITITTKVQALDRRTGDVILKPTIVKGMSATFIGNDLQTAEQQVLPLVAEDIGRQVQPVADGKLVKQSGGRETAASSVFNNVPLGICRRDSLEPSRQPGLLAGSQIAVNDLHFCRLVQSRGESRVSCSRFSDLFGPDSGEELLLQRVEF